MAYEVVFSDNASTDETNMVVSSFSERHPSVYVRQAENIGVTRNILYCPTLASGDFVWMVGDDDLVLPDALALIAEQLANFPCLDGHVACHAIAAEEERDPCENSIFSSGPLTLKRSLIPAGVTKKCLDRLEDVFLLSDVSAPLNFLSNVIFRARCWRDHVQPFLTHCEGREWFSDTITAAGYMCVWAQFLAGRPVGLLPRPLVVGFVGRQAIVEKWPTLLMVFFLDVSKCFLRSGADPACVLQYRRRIYQSKALIAKLAASDDPYTRKHFSVTSLVRDYGDDPVLWRSLLGAMALSRRLAPKFRIMRQALTGMASNPQSLRAAGIVIRAAGKSILYKAFKVHRRSRGHSYQETTSRLDRDATRYFQSSVADGREARVRHPVYLRNPGYVSVGRNFSAGPGLRIEAWDRYREWAYNPRLMIGGNVSINFNCHIAVIGSIEIGDGVLIGSNVLITDHHHGDMGNLMPGKTYKEQPLFSPGPIVIGNDVWIGENAAILGGVTIGAGSVVGANSVVTRNVAPNTVVAGSPARVVRRLSR